MKYSNEEALAKFGKDIITKLESLTCYPTSRLIYPAFEPEHADLQEYATEYIEAGNVTIAAYYYIPNEADPENYLDWEIDHYETNE